MTKYLATLGGERVAFTGAAWRPRSEVQKLVKRNRGHPTVDGNVTNDATVLVRGKSDFWRYEDFGRKEQRVSELVRSGRIAIVVQDFEFRKLLEKGRRARVCEDIAGQPRQWFAPVARSDFRKNRCDSRTT